MTPIAGILLVSFGTLLGYGIRTILSTMKKNSVDLAVSERIMRAREIAQEITDQAQARIDKKESFLNDQIETLDEKLTALQEAEELATSYTEQQYIALQHIGQMNAEEARTLLIQKIEAQHQEDFAVRAYKLEHAMNDTLNAHAKNILAAAIQRLASSTANELSTTSISLPSEETKGKIIGKEGRNIKTFERAAGVELLVDETPNTITVSCFDPVRRAIAAHALQALIADGRIQPSKIEEEIERAKSNINDIIKEKGAAAVYECGIYNFDPRLISILGRLYFRTSYGQNVLQHSIEMAHIAEMIASEIGADSYIAKAAALVHDIGKALDHEFEGGHVSIGVKVLRRFGTDERVIAAMKSHHDDTPHESVEAVIVQAADMISGSRPGARKDSADAYVKRIGDLESLVSRFIGVEKSYAVQAGREIRIFVQPEQISDMEAYSLARNIATSIENELRYPGQIKVTIIRETRITDYAR